MRISPAVRMSRSGSGMPAVGRGEGFDGAMKAGFGAVRPEDIANVKLGVADLPEEIIADAHLAGGADEQVGVGHAGGWARRRIRWSDEGRIRRSPARGHR